MFYVWLNGKNLRRFKSLSKAKLFAFNYLADRKLSPENDDFLICNPCDVNFENINVFSMTYNIL